MNTTLSRLRLLAFCIRFFFSAPSPMNKNLILSFFAKIFAVSRTLSRAWDNPSVPIYEIINLLGYPDIDKTDERGNRIIIYSDKGLTFKCLKILNEGRKSPKVSFITIQKKFKFSNNESICLGLDRELVHKKMSGLKPSEIIGNNEIWKNNDGQNMRMIYDKFNILQTITIF